MARSRKILSLMFLLSLSAIPVAEAQKKGVEPRVNFEFLNQDIHDILYALSVNRGFPIIADDTVAGTASLQYSGTDFSAAFDAFLAANRLLAEKGAAAWRVSRILVTKGEGDLLSLETLDATAQQILERLSTASGTTIIRDTLPSVSLSLRVSGVRADEAVRLVMKPFEDYEVIDGGSYLQVRKAAFSPRLAETAGSGSLSLSVTDGRYAAEGKGFTLAEGLDALFTAAGREYSSFVRGDASIERLSFQGRPFDEALELMLDQAGAERAEAGGMWFILPGKPDRIDERLRNGGKQWTRYDLKYLPFQAAQPLLSARFPDVETVPLPGGDGFFARASRDEGEALGLFVASVDTETERHVVRLKYLKAEEVLRNPPPSASRSDLVDAGGGETLFFVGSPERFARFERDLEVLDRPKTRIRYDLLIMQYQESTDFKWGFSAEATRLAPGDQTLVTGSLGNILKLNFDVITVLGYQFAARLDSAITENQAKVFADTTLYGLSGQEIKFQNTNTYRYRDYYIDSQTQETVYTGVTREITSGLVLNLSGWVSGDGMITTSVSASVSKRGADVSSKAGNPPPTSEKTITTQVRSRSGETVVLSGLRQNDSALAEGRAPWVSRIPLIGWLFRTRQTSSERGQMVIYLIPRVDLGTDAYDGGGPRTASVYERLVKPYLGESR